MSVLACGERRGTEPAESVVLVPGAILSRSLTGQGPYRFQLEMAADRFVRLDVEQRGVDVLVTLRDPAGRLLYEIDSPTGRNSVEPVIAVTPVAGRYLLTVAPLAPEAKGNFALKVMAIRPAGTKDRLCAASARTFARLETGRLGNDFARVAAAYRDALLHLDDCGEPGWRAWAEWHLGQALIKSGQLRRVVAALESAAAHFHELGDGGHEAGALNDLGGAWRKLGDPGRALPAYQGALHLSQAAGDAQGEAAALNNLGLVTKSLGDLQGAIGYYEKALDLWQRLGTRSSAAVTRQNLGLLYAMIGHDDEALDLTRQGLDELAHDQNPSLQISARLAYGWAQHLAGGNDAALSVYDEALALARGSKDRQSLPGLLDRRGTVLRALHRYDEAADSYAQALAASRRTASPTDEGNTLINLGALDLETGAAARAGPRLQRARELLAASDDPNGEASALTALSRAERRLGDLTAARQHLETALQLLETVRAGLRGSLSRGSFLAVRFNAYEELVSLLMEMDRRQPGEGHAREALEVAERARARNLVEEMAARSEGVSRKFALNPAASKGKPATFQTSSEKKNDPGPQRKKPALLAEIEALENRRRALAARNPHDPRLHDLDAALRSRSLELDRLAAAPGRPPSFASLPEIQSLADADTLVVVYLLAEPASFAWVVDQTTVTSHVLPGKERIEQLARRAVTALPLSHERATQKTAARVIRELSEAILAPLGTRLAGRRRLVILADGALSLVAFGALPAPGGMKEPLLAQHEIVMLPSATALLAQRRRLAGRSPAPKALAILADPVFSLTDERLPGGNSARAAADGQVAEGIDVLLHRLPYTAEEARAIARLVPPRERLLALGTAANRDLVLSGALRPYRILHFATHGLLDPVLPERSGVVLSLIDDQGKRREGFLSAPEVAALDLPAELAVLSACQTALGREVRGEGLVGLTQAFFRAGVRGVVVGYWNVDDRATSALMTLFYRNLLVERMPPAAALRAAQLSLRKEERWHDPYYWGGFSFHGDWMPGVSNNSRTTGVLESRR